jgi:hypothetical protein
LLARIKAEVVAALELGVERKFESSFRKFVDEQF